MVSRWIGAALVCGLVGFSAVADEPTFEQRAEVRRIDRDLAAAESLIASDDAPAAAGYWLRARQRIDDFVGMADPDQQRILNASSERLGSLRDRLIQLGADLPELPTVQASSQAIVNRVAPAAAAAGDADASYFADQVAPILVQKCGRCHIDTRRGQFGMATIETITQDLRLVSPGKPDESLLFTIVESGEMPRGRNKLTPDELNVIRQWVESGGEFGSADRTTNLRQLVRGAVPMASAPRAQAMPAVPESDKTPGPDEAVSFVNHIAPLLLDSCASCHVDPRQPRGGLSLATFAGLMQGGDNGAAIQPNRGEDSQLVKKLRGTGGGQRMPAGGAPLSDETIAMIARWIDQGAAFDGGNPNANVRDVVARAEAAASTHEELAEQRAQRAIANWGLVMDGKQPVVHHSEHFVILAPDAASKPEAFAEVAESLVGRIASQVRAPSGKPLVKGKIAAYLFHVRYDYSEFGKMIERREIPAEWSNHWGNNQVDAYLVFHVRPGDFDGLKPWLARDLTAAYMKGTAADVPDWFANGVGYSVAAKLFGSDDLIQLWTKKSVELTQKMTNRDDFISGRMTDDDAGLVAFQFVEYLKQTGGNRLNKMLAELRDGSSFERAFVLAFDVTPAELLQTSPPAPSGN
jgi:mono/diheme cytochrome c family protein